MKVNKLDKKPPDVATLIDIYQCNTKIGDKNWRILQKILNASGLVTTIVLYTKIKKVDNKVHDLGGLVSKRNYDTKI